MIIYITKNYRIHPLRNGEGRGWGKLRSWLDFFFPYAKNGNQCYIRAESSGPLSASVRQRDYFTFRAFAWDFIYEFVVNPLRLVTGIQAKRIIESTRAAKWAMSMGVSPFQAMKIGAIAFDTAVYIVDSGNSPQSAAYTCTGTNRYLVVGGLADIGTVTISSITYNSVAMTAIASQRKTVGNTYLIGVYGQGNPASGSNTVTQTNSSATLVRTTASSYSGAQQTDAADSSNSGESTSATGLSVATTVVAANSWVIGLFFNNTLGTKTAGANTTKRAAFVQDVAGQSQGAITDSNADQAAGSRAQALDDGIPAQDWVGVVMSIAPAAGGGGGAAPFVKQSNILTLGVS